MNAVEIKNAAVTGGGSHRHGREEGVAARLAG